MTDAQNQKPVKVVFRNSMQSCQYFFKNGKAAIFVGGRYITSNPSEIAELDAEIEQNHPNIRRGELYEPDMDDPLLALKNKIRAEIIAEEKAKMELAAGDPDRDMGKSEQGKINAQSTRDIASVSVNQVAGSGAQLTNLINKAVK